VLTGAAGILAAEHPGSSDPVPFSFPPDARRLAFAVREPFVSKASSANLVAGSIAEGQKLWLVSQMPQSGVIFSDGVESDFLEFNSGATVSIGLAQQTVRLWSLQRPVDKVRSVRRSRPSSLD
jgi:hypothetical protein